MTDDHKRRLTAAELRRVLASCGVDPDRTESVAELAGGTFNAVYRVRRREDADLVLKVAPHPDTTVMAYEHEIIHAEVAYYEAAEPTGWVPVPRLVHVDLNRTVIDSDFLLMTYLPGQGWHGDVGVDRPRLRPRLRRDLGRMVATLHQVTGPAFGYPRGPEVALAPTWSAAFTAMFDAVCADARRFGVELPVPVAELEALVRSRQDLLDEVTTPVLVHFDLWDGNILVDHGEVTGLIDGERAFWGDPVAEFVSLALLGDIEQDPAFLAGYREIAGPLEFDERVRARLSLYRCYLYLIMLVESGPRRFPPAQLQWLRDVVAPCLTTEIEAVRRTP